MRFREFLPDLSLAFILWTIIGVILAVALWLIIYGLFKITPKSLIPVHLEYIMAFFIFIVLPLFVKRYFYRGFSISNLVGLSFSTILLIGVVLTVVVFWFGRKYIEKVVKKIVYGLDRRITPLVWLFVFLLLLAVPFSVFKKGSSEIKYTHITSQERVAAIFDERRPNIILVTMDALTARDMQVYGYERPTTPFISEWAKDAIVFNRAYASSNWTTPTTMSLMTGQRPWTHRLWHLVANRQVVSNYEDNMPRMLKDYGYAVYGFIQTIHAHPETLGLKDAFLIKDKPYTFRVSSGWWFDKLAELFENRPIVKGWIFEKNPVAKQVNVYRPDIYTTLMPSKMVYNRFLEYILQSQLRSKSQQPFFAWLHVFPPHAPYLPPEPYMGMFGDAEDFNTRKKQKERRLFQKKYKPERQRDIDILRKRYDEFILYSDKQFELFLLRLAETVDMSNTIIILSSDHGDSFSHGYQAHFGCPPYEPVVHIPLIIKLPGQINGRVIDMPVEQIDIAPTILELAGIPVPAWMEGRSLLPLLNGSSLQSQPIFSMEFMGSRPSEHRITRGTIAVWQGDYKLIYFLENKEKLLFNLRTDPNETQNIFHERPDIGQSLIKLINYNLSLSRINKRTTQSYEK